MRALGFVLALAILNPRMGAEPASAGSPSAGAAAFVPPPHLISTALQDPASTGSGVRSAAGRAGRPEGGGAIVRGRLVMKDGSAPPTDATVTLLTGYWGLDYPETLALLGGWEAYQEMWGTPRISERLRAIGGMKPAHRVAAAADGSFEIAVPRDFPRFRFVIEADYAAYGTQIDDDNGMFDLSLPEVQRGVTLLLDSAGKIEGTLRGPKGESVGRAHVGITGSGNSHYYEGRSLEDLEEGRFVARGMRPGRWDAAGRADGFGPGWVSGIVVRPRETTRVNLVLPPEGWISGRVVDPSGKGVENAMVHADPFIDHLGLGSTGSHVEIDPSNDAIAAPLRHCLYGYAGTDADGFFRIPSALPGTHRIGAEKRGWVTLENTLEVKVPAGAGVEGLRLVLDPGASVAGRVIDSSGKPVTGARISAEPTKEASLRKGSGWSGHQFVDVAKDGTFRVTGLPIGPYVVSVRTWAGLTAEKSEVPPGTTDLVLQVGDRPQTATIAGVVRDNETGAAVPRFVVRGEQSRGRDGSRGGYLSQLGSFQRDDGSFEVSGLEAGEYQLKVEAEGFLPEWRDGVVVAPMQVRRGLEFALKRAATVKGRVVEAESGKPVGFALVRADAPGAIPFFEDSPYTARTSEDGTFTIGGLPGGERRLFVSHDEFVPGQGSVSLLPGEAKEGVTIAISRGGGAEGAVRLQSGEPLVGGRVRAVREDGDKAEDEEEGKEPFDSMSLASHADRSLRSREATLDGQGRFSMKGLPPGAWRFELIPPKRAWELSGSALLAVARATLEAGRVTSVEFPPSRSFCTVRGKLSRCAGSSGTPRISVHPGSAWAYSWEEVNADGSFAVRYLPEGPAVVEIHVPGDREHVLPLGGGGGMRRVIEVPAAPEMTLDVQLGCGEIRGRVVRASDGAPLRGFQVTAVPEPSPAPGVWIGFGDALTDADGRYEIRDLLPGRYRVSVPSGFGEEALEGADMGLAPEERGPIEVPDRGGVVVAFSLGLGATALVSVLDPDGKPFPAWVSLIPEGREGRVGHPTPADAAGIARFRGLRPGPYRVIPLGVGGCEVKAMLRPGEENRVEVRLPRTTRLRLRAESPRGKAIFAIARFLDGTGRETRAAPSPIGPPAAGDEGFHIAYLPPGSYSLEIEADGYSKKTLAVQVGDVSPQELVVRLERPEEPK